MLNFNFSEKGLGLVSPPHFVYHFSIKIILMLQSIEQGSQLSIFKNTKNFHRYDLSRHRRDKWNWGFGERSEPPNGVWGEALEAIALILV